MAQDFLGGRPPAGEAKKNYAGVKMSWLRERVFATSSHGVSPDVLRQLNGLGQTSRDHHSGRMLHLRSELDRLRFDDFIWTPYMLPAWRAIEPDWVSEIGEIETWKASVPIVLFMFVRYHHVDRAKRQFGSEQAVPLDPVNLDGFLDMSARGEDKWWPGEHSYWYDLWMDRRSEQRQIRIFPTPYTGMRAKELPFDAPLRVTQSRDPIVLPRDAPSRGKRARQQHPDVRRKGQGESRGGYPRWSYVHDHVGADTTAHEADGGGDQGGDGTVGHDADIDFFSGADLELVRFILQGDGSGSGSAPHASTDRPSGHEVAAPTAEMYEVFTCGDKMMDQIA
ncbi:hypothetical protein PIB30_079715 [Stylosanthes scabra]|uniref:Aminotransferase-like plant mobile domain-containing protein n=1 Tax=Stylosanthes scabra TaxID=79078 RepID=A0ABU6YQ66_9FABA|nr:hypothetical protein [Stylosanthes scabra]